MKKGQKIGLIIAAVVLGLGLVKNSLIKAAVQLGAKTVVGTPVTVEKLSIGLLNQKIRIKNFKVYNPDGFPKEILIDIPEVSVDYDIGALLTGKIHLRLLAINMKEMILIKNEKGELNVNSLKVSKDAEAQQKSGEEVPAEKKKSKSMMMQIDEMRLTVRKVIMKDFTVKENSPKITVYDVGIQDKVFQNISSAEELVARVMSATFGSTALKGAGVYGAVTILGTAFLPAGIAAAVFMDHEASQVFSSKIAQIFPKIRDFVASQGTVNAQDPEQGTISVTMGKFKVEVSCQTQDDGRVKVSVSAQRFMIPNKGEAERILYQISEMLK